MYLYNSLTRKKEEFKPLNPPNVGMYTCGPTVYNFVHIGNLRAYVFYDILKRVLLANNYKVKHVMNITDVDDKIINSAKEAGLSINEFSKKYTEAFFADIKELNILPATYFPKATEYIPQIIKLVQTLLDKGFAYKADDGSIYFSIAKFPGYGKLSGLAKRTIKPGARVSSDTYEKDNAQDFALWKAGREGEPYWDAPFGVGRPGWHIECSAMSMSLLGKTFDLHAGGIDLLFPHHENEIAQSESATGRKFVNYWVHNAHLLVDGKKMSKSLHNFYTLTDIKEKNFDPLALRYLFLTAHYRDPLNFTWESLAGAQKALERIKNYILGIKKDRTHLSTSKLSKIEEYRNRFLSAINDDLNTPYALAVLWEVVKSNIPGSDKYDLILGFDEVLGLGIGKGIDKGSKRIPEEVEKLVLVREELRREGRWEEADKIRDKINKMGYILEDTLSGPRIRKGRKNSLD
jgi:cysteinyl-tRNA synthetase